MTDQSLSRAFVSDIEVRADGEGRTVHGIIVPFGQVARVSDGGPSYNEMFVRGSFTKTIRERGARVKLLSQHQSRQNPLGRATLLREDAAGLYGEFMVSRTTAGDEALALVRDGALDSFSVGFKPIQHRTQDNVRVRTEVGLREASLVTFPAYEGALVGGVRLADFDNIDELAARLIEAGYTLPRTSPEVDPDAGTPTGAAIADEDPATPVRTAHQIRLAFARALRERGVVA